MFFNGFSLVLLLILGQFVTSVILVSVSIFYKLFHIVTDFIVSLMNTCLTC